MKAYFYIGAAVAAVLSSAAVNAQILDGNVAGGLGGTLSGGMRDMNVVTQGSGNGSFGGNLEMGSLRRSTTDITGRATNGVRNTVGATRERTRSGLNSVRVKTESAANAATSAAADAAGNATAATRQINATTNVAGSLASNATVVGSEAGGVLDVAHQQQLLASPETAPDLVPQAVPENDSGSGLTVPLTQLPDRDEAKNESDDSSGSPLASSLDRNASVQGSAAHPAALIEGSGNGSVQGSSSASKNGISANGSAQTSGTAGASLHR